ncbi:MAG: hypothetical protein WBB34_17530 [Xanthobacteraceae bacterium]
MPLPIAVAALIFCIGIAVVTPAAPSNIPIAASGAVISDTLRATLDVVRMLVTFSQKNYTDALSQAGALADRGNPMGMAIKAAILENGFAGPPDRVQARALLANAAQLGEPASASALARMMEQGLGGPRDPEQANSLYLFAARSMAAGADQDLVRLHLDGARGMTAMQAYQTLTSGNPSLQAAQAFKSLFDAHSTVAICLAGWLTYQAVAKNWKVTQRSNGAPAQRDQTEAVALDEFKMDAPRGDPWCEWGMGKLAATGLTVYPKNLVEADVFYRLAVLNSQLGSSVNQAKQELAGVESQMKPTEKEQADGLFHSAIPTSRAR